MRIVFGLMPVVFAGSLFAHDGVHHHPHGIEYGWIVAVACGVVGGLVLARIRGRK
jgi:hypothetical protein